MSTKKGSRSQVPVRVKALQRRIKHFKVGVPGDEQLLLEVYPKRTSKERHETDDIDIIRLHMRTATGAEARIIEMTPDEALELAQGLTTAAWGFLVNYKPYWDTFMKRKRNLTNNLKKKYGYDNGTKTDRTKTQGHSQTWRRNGR